MIIQSKTLSNHIIEFCTHLRDRGFLIGPQETMDSILAVQTIDIFNKDAFQTCLRLVLCSSVEEQPIFDYAFKEFFSKIKENRLNDELLHYHNDEGNGGRRTDQKKDRENREDEEKSKRARGKQGGRASAPVNQQHGRDLSEKEASMSWLASRMSAMQSSDQAYIPSDELGDMERAAKIMIRKIELKRAHAYQSAKKGIRLDFRKTLRKSLQTGGYPVHLQWKKTKRQRGNFVFLCDASRSMSLYAHSFLQFVYALSKYTRNVEVFLFSTKMKRVTDQLLDRQTGLPVLDQLGDSWGGGTCIGESIFSFVQDYGSRMLHKDTVAIIASDGLDAGDTSRLEWSMREIRKRTSAVLWLNPLLQVEGYEPTARGMKAALPYVDIFAEASDAQSFMRLAKKIQVRR